MEVEKKSSIVSGCQTPWLVFYYHLVISFREGHNLSEDVTVIEKQEHSLIQVRYSSGNILLKQTFFFFWCRLEIANILIYILQLMVWKYYSPSLMLLILNSQKYQRLLLFIMYFKSGHKESNRTVSSLWSSTSLNPCWIPVLAPPAPSPTKKFLLHTA